MSYYDDDDDDDYSSNRRRRNFKAKEAEMRADFKKYADKTSNTIQEDGLVKMGKTLGIDIYTDIFITYFFYKCKNKILGEVTEEEYIRGLKYFCVNTLTQLKKEIMGVREKLLEFASKDFREFYCHLFTYNVGNSKILPIDIVELYLNSLFGSQFSFVSKFIKFTKDEKKLKGLNKDQWDCFLDLCVNQGSTFPNNYSTDDCLPVLFDEFYSWYLDNNK